MDEPWEVAYGYIGDEPKVIRCANEEEAEALSRDKQISFGATSNWTIRARRVVL